MIAVDMDESLCEVGEHLSAIRLAYEHMSSFVQAVGTGGCDLVCQHPPQWSWSVFVVLWPTYCRGYSLHAVDYQF